MKKCTDIGVFIYLVLICAVVSFAADEYVRGRVIDEEGNVVSGALVSLLNYECDSVYTNDNGEFSLIAGSAVRMPIRLSDADIHVSTIGRGKVLSVKLDGSGKDVNVDLFTGNGSRILSRSIKNDKVRNAEIALNRTARGLILARVSVGKDAGYFKIMPQMGITSAVSAPETRKRSGSLEKKASESIDSVFVVARSYRNKLQGIESYTTENLEIVLSKSNPWIPDGELERSGSMVKIYANGHDFEMGSPEDMWTLDIRNVIEKPVHTVYFTYDFWMDTTEVTQKDYLDVMSAGYDEFSADEAMGELAYMKGDNQPIYNIIFGDIALYCNAKSKQNGYDTVYSYESVDGRIGIRCNLIGLTMNESANGYRLPTEAEWEYAYRGGTFTDYYWEKNRYWYDEDETRRDYEQYAVMKTNAWDAGTATQPVAQFLPNRYGLYDMAGNLSEFCNNPLYKYGYGSVTDPMLTVVYQSGQSMLRGGNWANDINFLRGANRTFLGSDYPYWYIGFRTIRIDK